MKKPRFKYPSVTEILEPYTDFSMVSPAVLKAAQVRGIIVHDLCASYAKFGFTPKVKIAKKYQGYYDSFRQWFDGEVIEVLACEERIYNDALRVCGQMDLLVRIRKYPNDLPIVVDIKTPTISYRTWSAQVSAYKFLVEHDKGIMTGTPASLRVKEDGSYPKFQPVKYPVEALGYWMKALECYHYFSQKGE